MASHERYQLRCGRPRGVAKRLVSAFGCTLGSLVIYGWVEALHTVVRLTLYPVFAQQRLLGPTLAATQVVGVALFWAMALLGLLLFRYLARLRPLVVEPQGEALVLQGIHSLEFWFPLLAILLIVHAWLLGHLHLPWPALLLEPALWFDLVLLLLFWKRSARQAQQLLRLPVPIALFLRPFASFSDRSLLSEVLNGLPDDVQTVFLVPRREPLSARDPLSLGLAGLRLLQPWRSTPLPLLASDRDWEACVAHLIRRSSLIVIDVTLPTASLLAEVSMLRDLRAGERTVVCAEEGSSLPDAAEAILEEPGQWLGVLRFRRRRRLGRSLLALGMTLFAVFGTSFPIEEMLAPLASWPLWSRLLLAALLAIVVLRYWYVVFARPGVGREVSVQLRRLLEPGWRPSRLWQPVAVLVTTLLFVWMMRIVSTWHVVAGQPFAMDMQVALLPHAAVELADTLALPGLPLSEVVAEWITLPDLPALEAAAQWITIPDRLQVLQAETSAVPGIAAWVDSDGLHYQSGIVFRWRARLQVEERIEPGPAEMGVVSFALRGWDWRRAPPRLLYALVPEQPPFVGHDVQWPVDHLTVYDTRTEAIVARLLHAASSLAILGLPVGLMGVAWAVMRR